MIRKAGLHLWLGFSLTSLFFYPLVASLAEGPYYMQWQVSNTVELWLVSALAAAVLAVILHVAGRHPRSLASNLVVVLISIVPAASFLIHVARQLGLTGSLKELATRSVAGVDLLALIMLGTVAVISVLAVKHVRRLGRITTTMLLVVSPLTLVFLANTVSHGLSGSVIAIEDGDRSPETSSVPVDTYIFVFDELDYELLYENGRIRAAFPNFRQLSHNAVNFHAATAPGQETLQSIPAMLIGRRDVGIFVCGARLCETRRGEAVELDLTSTNLFRTARAAGSSTVAVGWTHPYCVQFEDHLDGCRSFSLYNYHSVSRGFSLLNPVMTTVILWPHQLPFGFAKVPAYVSFQRSMVEQTLEAALAAMERDGPTLLFAHFSIPHLPFVFDVDGYAPPDRPFLQNSENYVRQLKYVDTVVGRIVDKLRKEGKYDGSNLVILSDHAYRVLRPTEQWDHVPMLLRTPGQTQRIDVTTNLDVESALAALVAASAP